MHTELILFHQRFQWRKCQLHHTARDCKYLQWYPLIEQSTETSSSVLETIWYHRELRLHRFEDSSKWVQAVHRMCFNLVWVFPELGSDSSSCHAYYQEAWTAIEHLRDFCFLKFADLSTSHLMPVAKIRDEEKTFCGSGRKVGIYFQQSYKCWRNRRSPGQIFVAWRSYLYSAERRN